MGQVFFNSKGRVPGTLPGLVIEPDTIVALKRLLGRQLDMKAMVGYELYTSKEEVILASCSAQTERAEGPVPVLFYVLCSIAYAMN